ncbi:MAG: hypothetical protein ACI30B_03895 [Paludibacteraceae bacterium]
MRIQSKPVRIVAMIIMGIIVASVLVGFGCSQHLTVGITSGILFFAWPWLGGKW